MRSRAAVNSLGSYPKDRRFESDLRNHLKVLTAKYQNIRTWLLIIHPIFITHFVKNERCLQQSQRALTQRLEYLVFTQTVTGSTPVCNTASWYSEGYSSGKENSLLNYQAGWPVREFDPHSLVQHHWSGAKQKRIQQVKIQGYDRKS